MNKAVLVLLCGLPGSGKTTLAKRLEVERNGVRLCADEWIYDILEDKNDIPEMDRLRNPVEKLLWILTKRLLITGATVILENGFWSKSEREAYRQSAENLGAEVELHYLEVELEELKNRLSKRNLQNLPGTFEIPMEKIEEWYEMFEAPDERELSLYSNYKQSN